MGYRTDRSKATCSGTGGPTNRRKMVSAIQIVNTCLIVILTQDFRRDVVHKRDSCVDELRRVFRMLAFREDIRSPEVSNPNILVSVLFS